jgi:hypothetical protein
VLAEHSKIKIWTEHASQAKTTCAAKLFGRAVAFRNTGGSWHIKYVQSTFFLECVPKKKKKWRMRVFKNGEGAHSTRRKI